ncbi:broad-complex core protein [Episyrphus balteatus]|uniref:broad-complex core protein n=1 Tax=Episyrphus balteatus TaxID=286459 RepID=UPI002486A686|nr:broad-complex core protein [Episyrphus balteatus]
MKVFYVFVKDNSMKNTDLITELALKNKILSTFQQSFIRMGGPTTAEGQTYCLRWNNHKSNLVEILDALIKIESYVDCTIVVDNQVHFKAHRVVLAANSPYFQSILQDVPMDHCSILFPGVQAFEMRALLEYMYTGEVNVTQSQIPKIMKIAEQLEVKGLFDMADLKEKFNKFEESGNSPYASTTAASGSIAAPSSSFPNHSHDHHSANGKESNEALNSSPIITTSTNISPSAAPTSSSSPTYSYKSVYPNIYSKSPQPAPFTMDRHSSWPISPVPNSQPNTVSMLSSVYDAASDMNPLKRKKLSSISSMLMNRDTPILRNVLAQSHSADSSQPMPLVCQPVKCEKSEKVSQATATGVNYCNGMEYNDKKLKYDEPHSPYTDRSYDDDGLDSPQTYSGENRQGSFGSQQQQKPEWKRYKQYTRSDILQAIECVRSGMSALQASRKFGVPSRTLYDKVKKLGITTGRPMNRTIKRSPNGSGGSGAAYTYHHSYGQSEPLLPSIHDNVDREKDQDRQLPPTIPHPAAALLDPVFLQQAFESRGGDIAGREALHAMALAAAAHAAVNGMSTSPGTNGTARSPSPSFTLKYGRSQSPAGPQYNERNMLIERERERDCEREHEKRIIEHEIKKERFQGEREADIEHEAETSRQRHEEENDQVEDLSVPRKDSISPSLHKHHGVIVPPMTTKLLVNDELMNENSPREVLRDECE